MIRKVSIKGGAGVANRIQALAGEALTAPGAITEISDEDAVFLKNHPVFQQHMEKGFVKIHERLVKVDKAIKDMNEKDESRPLTDADMQVGGRIPGAKLASLEASA